MSIGVFDSGHGGLTVLRALVSALPDQDFVYLGDHANAPYGRRQPDQIHDFTIRAVQTLFDQGCRIVVLACNTAAATALRRIQQEWLPARYPDRRVLGVLVPVVEAITGVPWLVQQPVGAARPFRKIGIFATPRTVLSNAYPAEIAKRAPEIRVIQQVCPKLAGAIEKDMPEKALTRLVSYYVSALMERMGGESPDAVVLGCTHYPLVAGAFAEALPRGVAVICQPSLVAERLVEYLRRHPELRDPTRAGGGSCRFLTSGDPLAVSHLGSRFFGRRIDFERTGPRLDCCPCPVPAADPLRQAFA
jgi:glutamate racemase